MLHYGNPSTGRTRCGVTADRMHILNGLEGGTCKRCLRSARRKAKPMVPVLPLKSRRFPKALPDFTYCQVALRPPTTPRQRGKVHIILDRADMNGYQSTSMYLLKLVLLDVPTTPAEVRRKPVLWLKAFTGIDEWGHTIAEIGGARIVFCGKPPKSAITINVTTLLRDAIRAASN